MKDIVERLRAADIGWSGDAACVDAETAEQGTAEIERMRAALERIKSGRSEDPQLDAIRALGQGAVK